jgi:hypothetical protein
LVVLVLGSAVSVASNFILLTPFTRSDVYGEDGLSLAKLVTNPKSEAGLWGRKIF